MLLSQHQQLHQRPHGRQQCYNAVPTPAGGFANLSGEVRALHPRPTRLYLFKAAASARLAAGKLRLASRHLKTNFCLSLALSCSNNTHQ